MSAGIEGKHTLDGKLFRVFSDDRGQFVERWTLASRRTGRHHWVRIWPPLPNGSTQHRATAERVIAAVKTREQSP